jgi:hypothetical protein
LILKPGELEVARDARAERAPPWGRDHVDSSSPGARPSARLGSGSSRGCHPCPYVGRSRALEMTESGIRDDFATLLGACCHRCCQICICVVSCSVGRCWGMNAGSTLTSSTTRTTVRQAMSVRDEGRPLGAGLRRQAPNHLERLGSRAPVVSVKEKARRDRVRCGSGRRTQVNHRRSVESVWTTSKPGSSRCSGISAGGDPLTASVASGIKVARVRSWLEQGTWEPVASM